MNVAKASAGGMTSRVNGQWYDGGEFMPVTGEYCGCGKNRITVATLEKINANLSGCEIAWNESAKIFQLLRSVRFANGTTGRQVMFSAANIKTLTKGL